MPGNSTRVQAIQDITRRTLRPPTPLHSLESLWASDVYTIEKMKEHLPKEVFKSLKKTI
jgi:glutamine synthetase